MDWRCRPEGEPGDEPDPDSGPPRHGQHYGDQPGDDEPQAGPASAGLPGTSGDWGGRAPSAELVAVLEALSGPGRRCPGVSGDELVTMAARWAAVESWAGAAKLGVVRELVRREDKPWQPADDDDRDDPDPWTESLTHNLSLALAASVGAAERTEWLAWELGTRLPGINALLEDGTLTYGKAKTIAETFKDLTDAAAAHAEALILGRLAGKTWLQVQRLAAMAAAKADPDGTERRRKEAEKKHARVRLWREQSGAAGLGGFDLPADETLAAHENVCARADQYKTSGAFPGARLDQLRAMAYLDLLNSVTAEDRIAGAAPAPARPDDGPPPWEDAPGPAAAGPDDPPATPQAPGDTPDDGPSGGDGPGGDHSGDGDPGGGGDGPEHGTPDSPGPGPRAARRPGTDLIIPLITLLGLGSRPGEAPRLGPLDPALCRKLAALAANSPGTEFCLTVTDDHGYAIGHGCARTRTSRATASAKLTTLAARINLTIPLTDLQNLTRPGRPGRPGSHWALTPRDSDHGPPGGHGTWTLTIPGGRELTARLEQVPTYDCDHARESRGYQPSDALRHLVQVRDGECTFPTCTRHARESDFEHAVPYHKGGRTCACNAGARSRKCHRIKQSNGWNLTQPKPGWHQWTTPTGHVYTQEPKRYPA